MKIPFTDYLHEEHEGYEIREEIYDQLKANAPDDWDEDFEEWSDKFGRPFYEVTLKCEYDTETGQVTILEAKC